MYLPWLFLQTADKKQGKEKQEDSDLLKMPGCLVDDVPEYEHKT